MLRHTHVTHTGCLYPHLTGHRHSHIALLYCLLCEKYVAVLLQSRLAQLQAERDELEDKATTSASRLDTTSKELEQIQAELKSKLEEQQSQFRALEEEQYGDWEKRVGSTLTMPLV